MYSFRQTEGTEAGTESISATEGTAYDPNHMTAEDSWEL